MTQFAIPTTQSSSSLTFGSTVAIDISDFAGEDYISFSLPDFPATKLDLTKTFVDFTSHETGDFGIGPTDSIAFSEANPTLEAVDGDTEMRLPISLLSTIDKSSLTGVRFRIYANSKCTFRCLSIRACSADWTYAPIDIDTLWDRVHHPPSTDGSANQASDFPTSESAPTAWPILFRSNDLPGASDPQPIDISIGAEFAAGSYGTASEEDRNELAFYFRDVPTDDQIQVELNSYTQAGLEVSKKQPDFGTALYVTRDQEKLNLETQTELDAETQFTIERLPDESTHSWLEVKLRWFEEAPTGELTIFNADAEGYTFKGIEFESVSTLDLNQGHYICLIELQNDSIRVRIFAVDQVGNIQEDQLIFDSGQIIDNTLIKRRKGRVGWWAQFPDGDAYLHNIRTRGTNFGEIISREFRSITPIKGVSLYAGATADQELVTDYFRTDPESTRITLDPAASTGGKALRVETTPLRPLQGIITNPFTIDDPKSLSMSFDIRFPSSEIPGGGLSVFLLGEYNQIIPIRLSSFNLDTWSKVRISLREDILFQTGTYQLVLMQTLPVVATTWWIENLSVKTPSIRWSARSHAPDAWAPKESLWQEVGFTLNSLNGGVVFNELGNGLQVRGQALKQDASIHDFKAIPQYATLGRFIWEDEFEASGSAPSSLEISTSIEGRLVTFTGSATDSDGSIVAYYWSFGDDSYDVGPGVSHTYDRSGTYIVTLTVRDNFGNATSKQKSVTV